MDKECVFNGGENLLLEKIKKVFLFKDLSEDEIIKISPLGEIVTFSEGEKLFNEGDVGDAFYIILKGQIRISKFIKGVGEEALAILEEGDYLGEMALICDFPRSATAIAHTDSKLLKIKRENFEKILKDVEISYKILWNLNYILSTRLRETNEKIKSLILILLQQ